jgi:hypothetical protein
MASVSLGLNRGADQAPDKITIGAVAAAGNDVVLSVDLTKNLQETEIIEILEAFVRLLEDGRIPIVPNV